jgi:predicted amidohydrolase
MHWDIRDNVRAMTSALRVARHEGATLCAFAELAVTGFHRRIVEWAKPEVSAPAVAEVCATAAKLGIAATFGAPTYGGDGLRFNSHLFVGPEGTIVGHVSKMGLTAAEATFFAPGSARPTIDLAGLRCSAVICREIEDTEQVLSQLQGTGVQLILWPGQMRPDPARPVQDPPEHVAQAQSLARASSAYVIQANWPNALNRPEESENTGHSACVSPTGELLFRLPKQGYGVAVFTLGEAEFRWHPSGT